MLRAYAIQIYDRGDGRGVDWSQVAALCFGAGFSCLKELPPTTRACTAWRRAHDAAYSLMTGSPDSGTPYTAAKPERPSFVSDLNHSPEPDLTP